MSPERSASKDDELSLFEIGAILLRHRRRIAALGLAGAVLMGGLTLLSPRTYTTRVTFMPQGGGAQVSRLAGMAAQFGFQIPSQQMGRSPTFYADLLRSEQSLQRIVEARYSVPPGEIEGGNERATLVEIYDVPGEDAAVRTSHAVDRLRQALSVEVRAEAGVVDVGVSSRWPSLSEQIADRLLAGIHDFNMRVRRIQAGEEREFLEDRVTEARRELLAAEDTLERFLERNRGYQGSPTLRFQYQRLQRRVDLKQQVYSSLAQSLEEARIEEVRSTPVVTVVAEPERPALPDKRWLVAKTALGGILGLILGIVWAYGATVLTFLRQEETEDYREWRRLREETLDDLRGGWNWVRRRLPF